MASFRVNSEAELLLEHSFARVPHENYRKVFRAQQRHVERELNPVAASATSLLKTVASSPDGSIDVAEASSAVDGMIARVEALQRKLAELHENTGTPTLAVLRQRTEHLRSLEATAETSMTPSAFDEFCERRLDRWVVDWALRHGRTRTARTLAQTKHMETLVDIDLFEHLQKIETSLAGHCCTEALAWCSENKAALRKVKSTLEIELRLQEFIELARGRKAKEALAYFQKHLASWQDTHIEQLQQAVTLLAFSPSTSCAPYKRLYDPSRWPALVQSFRLAFLGLLGLPAEPLLHLALFGGLAALRLPACGSAPPGADDASAGAAPMISDAIVDPMDVEIPDGEGGIIDIVHVPPLHGGDAMNVDCPACALPLSVLARSVPRAHHSQSAVVCAISGAVMDADNPPLAFPNGYVYSRQALEEMAAQNDGRVKCPRSGLDIDFASLRKVFVS